MDNSELATVLLQYCSDMNDTLEEQQLLAEDFFLVQELVQQLQDELENLI